MKKVVCITIIVGPPGPDGDKERLEASSKTSGRSSEEMWIEFVQQVLEGISRRESPDSTSDLDALLSSVLEMPAKVGDPILTTAFQRGRLNPSIILDPSRITTAASGEEIPIDWSSPDLRKDIGAVFGLMFKSEWVQTYTVYEP